MKIVLVLAAALVAVYFIFKRVGGGSSRSVEHEMTYGPFTIQVKGKTGKRFDLDKGSVSWTNVAYSVLYKGQPVPFPKALQTNTGLPWLWRVYALPGAPDPTLIAGSQSLYLIYIKNDAPVVEPILEQGYDFASVQFLDSENGQPGPYNEVFAKGDMEGLDTLDSLAGGRFLLVGEHAVLDVQTRSIRRFNMENNSVENYSFPSPHGALSFSPDRNSIAFRGAFQSWNTADENLPDTEHAIIAYNIETDKGGQAIIFDDTELRVAGTEDMNAQWFEKFFEWEKSESGDRLRLRKFDRPPYWSGRYRVDHGTYPYYTLYPVKASILPAFLAFLERTAGWTQADIVEEKYHEYTGRIFTFASGDLKFDLTMKEDEQNLQFSKHLYADDDPKYLPAVKKIVDAFEAELASGKHQEHFGKIISQTKQIRGLGKEKE